MPVSRVATGLVIALRTLQIDPRRACRPRKPAGSLPDANSTGGMLPELSALCRLPSAEESV